VLAFSAALACLSACSKVNHDFQLAVPDLSTAPAPSPSTLIQQGTAAPTDLAWTANTGTTISLAWTDNASDGTGYQLQSCAGAGCTSFADVAASPLAAHSTSFTLPGLSPSAVVAFQLRSLGPNGPSQWVPSGNLVAFNGVDSIDQITPTSLRVNWTAVPTAVAYLVFDVTSSTPALIASVSAPATSDTVTTLSPATAYKFRVRVLDGTGASDHGTNDVPATTPAIGAPSAPTSLVVGTVTASSVALSWTDTASNATAYELQRCTGSGCSSFADLSASLASNAVSYADGSVAAGTTYRYQVRATNSAGGSAWLASGDVTTPPTVPGAPSNLVWNANSGTTIGLAWTDSGATETGTQIQSCAGTGCTSFLDIAGSPFAANLAAKTITGLTPSATYRVRIRSLNLGASSGWLTSGDLVAFNGIDAPGTVTPTQAQLTWTQSTAASAYLVYDSTSGTPALIATVQAPVASTTVTSLSPATSYKFRVRLLTAGGQTDQNANDVDVTTAALGAPAAPSALIVTATTTSSIAVSWTDNDASATSYDVQACTGSGCSTYATVSGSPLLSPTASSYSYTGLTNATTYRLRVRAENGAGPSAWLTSGDIATATILPPSNLVWTGDDAASVSFSWTDNAVNPSSYEVQSCIGAGCSSFADVSGDPYGPAQASATDSGRTAGTYYRYRVRALDPGGSSAWLTGGTFVAFGGISSITGIFSNQVQLNWSGVGGASAYVIYDVSSGTPTFLATTSAPATSFVVSGLTPSTTYKYRVRTMDGSGNLDMNTHDVSVTTPAPAAPSAPTGLAVTGSSLSSLTVGWTNNDPSVTSYDVQLCSGSGCSSYAAVSGSPFSGILTSYTASGLTPQSTYRIQVRADNSAGSSAWLTSGDLTTPASASPPADPSNLVWTGNTANTISVTWTDNATNELAYEVQSCANAGCSSFAAVSGSPFPANTTSYQLASLSAGSSYRLRVRATNSYGDSNWLTSGDLVAFGGLLPIGSVTSTSLQLSWNAVGSAASYSIYNTAGASPVYVASVAAGNLSYAVTGLSPATSYTYRVRAFTASGVSDENTNDVSQTTAALAPPAAPTNLVINSTTTSSITISWTGGDSTTTSYDIQACNGSACSAYATLGGSPVSAATTTYAYTGLSAASTYRMQVRATNGAGSSAWLQSGDITTPGVLAPSNLTWTANDGSSVSLSWTDNAVNPQHVEVQSCSGYGCSSFSPITGSPFGPAQSSYVVGSLAADTYFSFRVRSTDAGGASAWATIANTVSFAGAASTSGLLSTQVQVSWATVPGAASYAVYNTTSGSPVFLASVNAPATSYVVTGLSPSTAYQFRVRTFDVSGASDKNSAQVSVTTPAAAPPANPTAMTIGAITSGTIAFSWTNNAPDATSFDVQECLGSGCSSYAAVSGSPFAGIVTSYVATGLATSTTYGFRVRANNAAGASAWLATGDISTTGAVGLPSAPSNLAWTANTATTITTSWTANATNATAYEVQSCSGSGCSSYASVTGSPFASSSLATYTLSGLTEGSVYGLRVRATNSYGASAWLSSGDLVAFGGVSSGSATPTTVQLGWTSVGSAASYSVYNTTSGSPVFVASAGAGATSYVVSGLTPATAYKFRVREFSPAGASDQNVNDLSQSTAPLAAPAAPTNLVISSTTTSSVAISWTGGDPTTASYDVQACQGASCSGFATVGGSPVSSGTTSYSYTGLTNATVYRLQVRATNSAGSSAWLASGNITTLSVLAPSNLVWSGDTGSAVSLSWTDNAVNPTGTVIQSCSGYACSGFSPITGSPFGGAQGTLPAVSLAANTYYTFRVQSTDAGGGSAWLTSGNTVTFGGISSTSNVLATQLQLNWPSVTGAASYTVYNTTTGSPVFLAAVGAPATSYTVTGLSASTAYKFRVRTMDAGGNLDMNTNDVMVTTPAATPPNAPTALSVTGTSAGSITISWTNNAPDATSYDVQQCTGSLCSSFTEVSGAPFSGILTTYTATGLLSQTTYRLQVRANNAAGGSAWLGSSDITTQAPASPPAAPSNLVWSGNTATTIALSWSANATNATAYDVQSCTGVGCSSYAEVSGSPFSNASLASYSLTGLTEGTSYGFRVRATNSYGQSAWLSSGNLVAFGGLTSVGSPTSTSLQLNWNAVGSSTSYTIYNTTSGSPVYLATVSSATSYVATGLSASTAYKFRVRTFDINGVSDQNSNDVTQTTSALSAPAAPTGLVISQTTTSSISITWTDNDSTATGTVVQACTNSGCSAYSAASGSPLSGTATSYTYSGLTNATTYRLRVAATNSAGSSSWLTSSDITTQTVLAPSNLSWTGDTASSVSLTWTDNAISPTGYVVQSCSGFNCSSFSALPSSPYVPSTTGVTVGGLTAGTYYTFRVQAADAGGGSAWLTSGNTVAFGGASSLSNVLSTQAQVNWSAVSGASSYAIYNVTSGSPVFVSSVNAPATSYVVTGLSAATAYSFRARTVDSNGNSDQNTVSASATTPSAAPAAAPTGMTVGTLTSSSVTLSWTNNAPDATSYDVWQCTGSGCSSYSAITGSPFTGILTTTTITGLSASTTYGFEVRANNATGASSWLATGNVTTSGATTAPAAPSSLAWTGNTASTISVSWTNNATNATAIELQSCSGVNCSSFADASISPLASSATAATLSSLTAGGVYRVQIRAQNAYGNSAWLTSGNLVAFGGIGSTSNLNSSSVQLNWTPAANSSDFTVYNNTGGTPVFVASVSGGTSSYVVTGLSGSTTYSFLVRSFDSSGNSDQNSNSASVTTPAVTPPSAPTGLFVASQSTSAISIQWTNTASNATGIAIQRCVGTSCSSYSQLAGSPLSSTTTSYVDSTVTSGVVYSYEIQAQGPSGTTSAWVQLTNVSATLVAPVAAAGFTVGTITTNAITFSWTNVSMTATSVIIQRCSGSNCTPSVAIAGSPFTPSTTTVTDTGLSGNTTYNYSIVESNSAGNSAALASGNITTLTGADTAASILTASSAHVPHDGSAKVTIVVVPRTSGGSLVGAGQDVEISASATATVSGASSCHTVSAQCATATDLGTGAYSVTATSSSVATVTFSAVVWGPPQVNLTSTANVVFNTANFTTISSNTTVTSAGSGVNYYVTGGTATFNSTTVGATFGDLFVNGGTVAHTATTTTTQYALNFSVTSLTVQSGGINVNNLGYTVGYSWSNGGTPSTTWASTSSTGCPNCGGSHGGQGGLGFGETPYSPTFDDYRNPMYPGGGGGSQNGSGDSPGGGVVRITSSGLCTVYSGGTITANSSEGGAGGTVYLSCAGFTGNASTSAITANGGNVWSNGAAGGGGRIALISSGLRTTTFTNSFAYPTTASLLTSFKTHLKATGGTGGYACCTDNNAGNGGAGTIYLSGSDSTYGDLIVDNGGIQTYAEGGTTMLVSLAGTVAAAHSAGTSGLQITGLTGSGGLNAGLISANATNLFTGMRFRPDLTLTSGPPDNWSNDDVQDTSSNTTNQLTSTSTFQGVTSGVAFRSIDVLDHLDVANSAVLETYGDLWPVGGQLSNWGGTSITWTNAFIKSDGSAGFNYSTYSGTTNVAFGSGTVIASATAISGALTVSGGALTLTNGFSVGGGTSISAGTLTANSTFTNTGTLSISGSGGMTVYGTLTSSQDLTVNSSSASALVATTVNAPDLILSSGTISHPAATSSAFYALVLNLTGSTGLLLSGGAINVNNLGYTVGYSWSGGGTPSTVFAANNSNGNANVGGSHGGQGGLAFGETPYPLTYDDYHNPIYPGGGGGSQNGSGDSPGGGVVRVVSTGGPCTINTPATITANSSEGGAGGTVNLQCTGFAGTAGTGAVSANGGNIWANGAAGGGGRVALISSGTKAGSFSGNFAYPTNSATLTSFKTHVKATGGTGGYACCTDNNAGNGAAGTIYLAGSDSTYGDLIIDNAGIQTYAEGGNTMLVSLTGTVAAAHTSGTSSLQVTTLTGSGGLSSGQISSNATNLFTGLRFRPDLTVTSGPPDNWANDDVQIASTNDTGHLVSTANFQAVASGVTFRSIDILDHIDIANSATVETYGDLWPVSGQLSNPGQTSITLANAFLKFDGSSGLSYPSYSGALNETFSTGTVITSATAISGSMTVTGGSLTFVNGYTVGGGTSISAGTVTADSSYANTGTLSITGSGSMTAWGALTSTGDITVNSSSSSALVGTTVNAPDLTLTAGTITHPATTSSTMYSLVVNLTGTTGLVLNGGTINANSLGYLEQYSWSSGGVPSSTTVASGGMVSKGNCGGSHGGLGGISFSQTGGAGPTYDDYHNPIFPGAGEGQYGGGTPGGGVIRINSTGGPCMINTPATITANGGGSAAGGTVNLQCTGFSGTAGTSAITANGGATSSNTVGGGGGRIALISSGTKAGSFSGNFAYPTSSATLTAFKTHVQAYGGTGGSVCCTDSVGGNGGAGTIYLAGSDSTYGDLVVDNGGITTAAEGGSTLLVSMSGTTAAAHTSGTSVLSVTGVSSYATYNATNANLYAGMRFRPDLSVTSGPPDNWATDDPQIVQSNTSTQITTAASYQAVASGASFRSIDLLDHLDIGGNAIVETYGDLWPVNGQISYPGQTSFTLANAFLKFDGSGSLSYPTFANMINATYTSGTVVSSATSISGALTVSGANVTFTSGVSVGAGTSVTSGSLTANSTFTNTGTLSITGSGAMESWGTLTSSGDITVNSSSSSALVATTVNAPDLTLTAGTITHPATTSSTVYSLIINLTGTTGLLLNGGTINVNSLGYPEQYSWSSGGVPSNTTVASGGMVSKGNCGGSHGGLGGISFSQTGGAGPTYDSYRNPIYPGAGEGQYGGNTPGGGVVRITSSGGPCTINTPATITANGGGSAAGGTVNLQCTGFAGTAGTSAVTASGGATSSSTVGGGGGRIALVSSGTKAGSFSGNFAYPTNSATLASLKTHVQAYGGTGGSVCCTDSVGGNGGAGTIYLAGSDSTYGDLIVDNGGITTMAETGTTMLVSMAGTASAAHTSGTSVLNVSGVSSYATFNATNANLWAGTYFRPDLSVTSGPPDNWTTDDPQTVLSTDATHVTATANYQAVASGASFRSIDILDHLDVGGNATLESYGDIWPVGGQLANPGQSSITLTNAFLKFDGSASLNYPVYAGTLNVNVTGGTLYTPAGSISGALTQTGGALTLTSAFTVGGGTSISAGSLTADSTFTNTGALSITGSGAMESWGTLTNSGDITVNSSSGSALVATTVNALDLTLSSGTITHPATTSSTMYSLIVNLTGTTGLLLNGGTINVNSLGYPEQYSWSSGGVPSNTTVTSGGMVSKGNCGGSHGGLGGISFSQTGGAGPTYDDYHNPIYPGAGEGQYGGNTPGGGVVRVSSANGPCTINTPATITANGGGSAAGGTVNLQCTGFAGTAGTSAITANGGATSSSTVGGGGGRIALISSGTKSGSFGGNFTYPTGSASLAALKTHVQAYGGAGGSVCCTDSLGGNGGAGTIYLAGSDSTYGDLVVDNGGVTNLYEGGTTMLVSIAGTVSAPHSSGTSSLQVSITGSSGGFASFEQNLYAGIRFRPDLTYQANVPDNWANDDVQFVTSNDTLHLVSTTNFQAVSSAVGFRSIDLLDTLDVGGGATVESYGDIWPVHGPLSNPGSTGVSFSNGFLAFDSGSLSYPTFTTGTNVTVTSGTIYSKATSISGTLSMTGGALYLYNPVTIGTISMSGSSVLTASSSVTTNGGGITIAGSSELIANGALTVGGDIDITATSGTNLVASTISAGNFVVSNGGTVQQTATTTTTTNALSLTLTGNFDLYDGTINVSGEGYPGGYSFGSAAPSTSLASNTRCGGSHGGLGGYDSGDTAASCLGTTYDDFRNPALPGAGINYGASETGGGVVRVVSAGTCEIDTPSSIKANGSLGAAGGSIYLNCGVIQGTAGSAAIQADGGAANYNAPNISGGGGGRIALVTSGTKSGSFSGSFSYPTGTASSLSSFKSVVQAYGGVGTSNICCSTYTGGNGGAGSIYLAATGDSTYAYGDLIVDNSGVTVNTTYGGSLQLLSTTTNGSTLYQQDSATQVQITAAGTPLTNMTNIFKNQTIALFQTSASANPLSGTHTNIKLDGSPNQNDSNDFFTSSGSFPSFSASSYYYRFLTELDHLDLGGGAVVNTNGSDVILTDCDLHSSSSAQFDVPTGSKITGNSMASGYCSQTLQSSEEGTRINFTNYYLQP
jgi:titin